MEIKTLISKGTKERADVYISKELEFSRSKVQKLIEEGKIKADGRPIKAKEIIGEGVELVVEIEDPKELDLQPKDIPIDIIYQDDDLAVINKAQGMTVHPGNGTKGDTLVNALLYYLDNLSGINGVQRPGIVHRIDKDTSGLIVVAKNDKAHLSLSKQIENKTCHRIYVALLEGNLKEDSGRIETFIGRSLKNRTMMAVTDKGRKAITNFEVIQRYQGYTLCKFKLETGRTHQIRVHAKYLGHPIVGDEVYGIKDNKFKLDGQLLHAKELIFKHPSTNEEMRFEAPIPSYFEEVVIKLKKI